MTRNYHVTPEIRMLIQTDDTEQFSQIREKVYKREMIPTITVWNDIVIDNILLYEECIRNRIEFRSYNMAFPSTYHVYSWICNKQLERKDLTDIMRRFLLGYLALAESAIYLDIDDKELKDVPAKKEPVEIVAKCFGLSSVCIFNYKKIAESILGINKISPSIVNSILKDKLKITNQQIVALGNKNDDEIKEVADRLRKYRSKEEIKYSDLFKKEDQTDKRRSRNGRMISEIVPEIRKMPEFDPDAELTSLSLTLPVWINSISRVYGSEIGGSSIKARNELYDVLCRLGEATELLKDYLESGVR